MFSILVISCTENQKKEAEQATEHSIQLDDSETKFTLTEINDVMRIRNINSSLDELITYSDSTLYKKRKEKFNKFLDTKNHDYDNLETYVISLEKDFNTQRDLPIYFKEQISLLKQNLKHSPYEESYFQIIQVEELLYNHQVKNIYRVDGIDRLVGSIFPHKKHIKIGETLKTGTGIIAYNLDSHYWYSKTSIYFINNDTLLVKSFVDTLGVTGSGFQTIEFTPSKKGKYFIKAEHTFFSGREYKTTTASSTLTVE